MKAKVMLAVMMGLALGSGFKYVETPSAHTRKELPKQPDEERNEKLAKAEAKRQRKSEKKMGAKQ